MRSKIEEKTLRFFVNKKIPSEEKGQALKSDGKHNISYLSSVDNFQDNSNDKDDWIS